MLLDPQRLEEQLRDASAVDAAVRDAYLACAHAQFPNGITVRPSGHGYIERELRFEAEGDWLYSAVLNQKWVLWYFRKPALNAGHIDPGNTKERFPASEETSRGEIKIRVRSSSEARAVLKWIGAE
ncbi:MAG: hypothetical protein ACU0DW_14745 [Shimia sp.]